jgi:hypothetical protein
VCRACSSDPRLPSAVVGVMADHGVVEGESCEWFRRHAETLAEALVG